MILARFLLFIMLSTVALAFVFGPRRASPLSAVRLFSSSAKETATAAIKANKIMVFSKTHCPYCKKAKEEIKKLDPSFGLMELDEVKDGADVQAALLDMTGQRTVPNIFVNGKHVGGCDNTLAAIASGEFQKMMKA